MQSFYTKVPSIASISTSGIVYALLMDFSGSGTCNTCMWLGVGVLDEWGGGVVGGTFLSKCTYRHIIEHSF